MKFLRNILVIMLALVMIFAVACTKEEATVDTKPTETEQKSTETKETEKVEDEKVEDTIPFDPMAKYDPPIVITSIKGIPDGLQFAEGEDFENNLWSRSIEEQLGITIKFLWSAPANQFEQKLSIAVASNDLPDIIPAGLPLLSKLVESGVATDMTDIIDEYLTPFTRELFEEDDYLAIKQATINGRVMGVPQAYGAKEGASMLYIRADWLEELGLEVPKTIEDLIEVAKAFKEQDPNKTGVADTIGLPFNKNLLNNDFSELIGFFEGYGAYVNGWVSDGNGGAAFGGIQPEARDALEMLSKMYKDGLLDMEFSVKDSGKVAELTTSGNTGLVYGPHWIPFWPLNATIESNPDARWLPFAIPSVNNTPAKTMINGSAGNIYIVNTKSEHPEAAVKLYNYAYSKLTAWSDDYDSEFNADLENKYSRFQYAAVTASFPNENLFIYNGVKESMDTGKESDIPWISSNVTQINDYLAGDDSFWQTWAWSGPNGAFSIVDYYDNNDLFMQNRFISAATPTMVEKKASLDDMMVQVYTKIIMGTEDISAFDKFVEDWKNLGGDMMTEEVNALN